LAGPTATIQNTPPLVTSSKARKKYGLPPRHNPDGSEQRFDVLRAQRLAKPATVYVECFSAHPLESDAAELYGPPDGYLDGQGVFHKERSGSTDRAVYEVEIAPEDGLYPLPYMARQADGSAWEEECTSPGAPAEKARQGFFPDGSGFEILSIGMNVGTHLVNCRSLSASPDGRLQRGCPRTRTDIGNGDLSAGSGKDFFAPALPSAVAAPARFGQRRPMRRILAKRKI
jgi:hypothetical protein